MHPPQLKTRNALKKSPTPRKSLLTAVEKSEVGAEVHREAGPSEEKVGAEARLDDTTMTSMCNRVSAPEII